MRKVTICMAYYMNPIMLQVQFDNLARQPKEIKNFLRYIIVDDGSPSGAAYLPHDDIGVPIELYRMREDIPWAQDACRNLAAKMSGKDFILLTDMDHVPSDRLLKRIVEDEELNKDYIYTFRRINAPDGDEYKPHPNSWLMTTRMYDKIGGYDERYCGCYGTDGMFKDRVLKCAKAVIELPEPLIRYPREVIPDASTTTLDRKTEQNAIIRSQKHREVNSSGNRAPQRGLMKWDRIV